MNQNQINNDESLSDENSIDLSYFFRIIIRNKKLVGIITMVSILLSFLFFLNTKKTWEGQFQIVLSSKKRFSNNRESLSSINLLRQGASREIKTQVGILESPSILMPIFEYVKKQKIIDDSKYKDLNYYDWKESLKVKLTKNTDILNISYKDKNKKIILSVLNKMSNSFQKYSNKNRRKRIELTKNYLSDQIDIFKNKSAESIKSAQKFAMSQDLFMQETSFMQDTSENKKNSKQEIQLDQLLSNVSIEKIRVNAANRIRNLNEQLNKIIQLEDPKQLMYFGSIIPEIIDEGLPLKLQEIENKLSNLRVNYQEKDRKIRLLKEERNILIKLLKENAIGKVKAKIISAEAMLKSSIRPEGVILEYKKLMREAQRDESTLINLENQYNLVKLEEAKYEDPWELITNPTLMEDPISPSLRLYLFFGLLFGLTTGSIYAAFKESKSGKIYEKDILNSYFKCPQLIELDLENKSIENFDKEILQAIISISPRTVFLRTLDIEEDEINKTRDIIENNLINVNSDSLFFVNDYNLINEKDTKILILKLSSANYDKLKIIKTKIDISKLKIDVLLLI